MPSKAKVLAGIKAEKDAEKKADLAIAALPKNWPEDVEYLTDLTFSARITPELRRGLGRDPSGNSPWVRISAETVEAPLKAEIRLISDEKHPAFGQRGLFAAEPLVPDSFICLYLGHVHTNSMSDTDPHSDYDLALDRELDLSVDGSKSGNEGRFTNDYRGIAERPNAEFRDCFVQIPCSKRAEGMKWERRVGIFVLSVGKAAKRKAGIRADEEILISYGKGYWESRKVVASFRKDEEMLRIANLALEC